MEKESAVEHDRQPEVQRHENPFRDAALEAKQAHQRQQHGDCEVGGEVGDEGSLERSEDHVLSIRPKPRVGYPREIMPTLIAHPARIEAAGNKPKIIEEFVGRVNSETAGVSVAHMISPSGWEEPGQTPEFDEVTVVVRGALRVEHRDGAFEVQTGQAVITHRGEWVRYSSPGEEGAEYFAVCVPAFSPETVHRDAGPEARTEP